MSSVADGFRAFDRFVAECLGVGVQHHAPDGRCPGCPDASGLGVCGHVGPHGPHPADQKPTYRDQED